MRLPMDVEQSGTGVIVVATVAVPEQVAVPFESVAMIGGAVAFRPPVTMVSAVPLAIVFALVKATVAVAPVELLLKLLRVQVCPVVPAIGPSQEVMVAVPEQVAVPLDRVAVVGGAVAPVPAFVRSIGVPLAIVFVPVKVTVAVAPLEPLLKSLRVQVCPTVPVIVPPES